MSKVLSVLIILFLPVAVLGTTWFVPGDAPSIQGGLDLAAAGDTVQVAPGVYTECSHVAISPRNRDQRTCCFELKNGVVLIGDPDNPESVVVDAQQQGGVACAFNDQVATMVGLTLRNGSTTEAWNGSGGALYAIYATANVENCVFLENESPDHGCSVQQ